MRVDHRQTSGLLIYKHGQEFVPVATEKQVLLVVSISPGFFANLSPPYEATSFTCTCNNICTSISCMAPTLIGYFKVTWYLTMKLFPAKISEQATLQNLWRQRVTVLCYLWMLTQQPLLQLGFMNFQLQNFQLCNKSPKYWSLGKQLCISLKHWDSLEPKFTVSQGTTYQELNILFLIWWFYCIFYRCLFLKLVTLSLMVEIQSTGIPLWVLKFTFSWE